MSSVASEDHPPERPAPPAWPQTGMQRHTLAARIARMARKELRETLRDRRTIVTLVLMPLLVYPLLSIAFQRYVLTTMPTADQRTYRLGFRNDAEAFAFSQFLLLGDQFVREADRPGQSPARPQGLDSSVPRFERFKTDDLDKGVATGEVDVGVRIVGQEELDFPAPVKAALNVELLYDPEFARSRDTLQAIERRLALVNQEFQRLRLEAAGVKGRASPVETQRVMITTKAEGISFPLATLVPFVLILTTITGAVYPAIDLTAGERERGTLEMLIAAPVPRLGLLIAKYVAVVTVAMLTALVNCGAMTVTVYSIGLGRQLFGERGLTAELAIEFGGLLLLFAAFFSAVLLALTSFARSFKEAQAYLVPLMLASTAPGIFTMINGVRLSPLLAITPLANIVLLARDMFEYNADPLLSLLVLGSTLVYAIIAILVAARLFGSDAVLYGSSGSWSEALHPAAHRRQTATQGTALLTLAALSPVYVLASNVILRAGGDNLSLKLGLSALATLVLFAVAPLVVAWWRGVPLASGLAMRRPSLWPWPAAVLLGGSLWPFAHEIVIRQQERGWFGINAEKFEQISRLVTEFQSISPVWLVLCMGLVPAVAEELCFRGFLLGALRTRQTARMAVLTSAAIFGLFHVVVTDSLLLERFLPTTFLGLVLGWLAVRSGSVWPGVLLHAVHNSLLLLLAYYRDDLRNLGWGAAEQTHLPASWLITAALVAGTGLLLMTRVPQHTNAGEQA